MNEDHVNAPLITNIPTRRKQIPRWKRILCCGIFKKNTMPLLNSNIVPIHNS